MLELIHALIYASAALAPLLVVILAWALPKGSRAARLVAALHAGIEAGKIHVANRARGGFGARDLGMVEGAKALMNGIAEATKREGLTELNDALLKGGGLNLGEPLRRAMETLAGAASGPPGASGPRV